MQTAVHDLGTDSYLLILFLTVEIQMFIVPPTGVLGFCSVGLKYCITHPETHVHVGKLN